MTAGATLPADIAAAYRTCEQITGEQARNFAWGIRLLPGAKRPDQVDANVAAADLPPLTEQQMAVCQGIYDRYIRAHVHRRW